MLVSFHKYAVRNKSGYHSPPRYTTTTYCIVTVDGETKHKIALGVFGTYTKTIEAVKKKYPDAEYKIDYSKPYVHYT